MLKSFVCRIKAWINTSTEVHSTLPDTDFDTFYHTLEQHFRGSEETIYQRMQESYQYIQAHLGGVMSPALDIGCGRGEWLAVLKSQGIQAQGIDGNRVMVKTCVDKGLTVREADLFDYLRGLPDNSLGFISLFHVIEHLPVNSLLVVLADIRRVLKPGGRVWLETPNPENLIVAAHRFYMDPTHQRPLPPDLMKFMLDYQGFSDTGIHRFQPVGIEHHLVGDNALTERFNHLMYGAQDYAVSGLKS